MNRAILRRASALAAFGFAWSAALNVLPQIYLLKHHPEHKGSLLSAVLFTGTIGSLLGVGFSRGRLGARPSLLAAGACAALFLAVVLEVRPLPLYALAYVLFRFTSNWLSNQLDHALLHAAGAAGAQAHATAATGLSILGQLTGPVVFIALTGHPGMVLGVLAAVCGWWIFAIRDVAPGEPAAGTKGETSDAPAPAAFAVAGSRRAVAYVLYGVLMLTGVAGFSTQLVFLLRDYLGSEDAGQRASLLVMGMGVVSIVTVLISSRAGGGLSRGSFMVPGILTAVGTAVFAAKPGGAGLVLVALLAGISAGRMLLSTRVCAATWEGPPGRATMLSLYNNLANVGALLAYTLTGAISLSLGEASALYHPALLALLFALFCAATIVCAVSPFGARSPEAT